MPVATNKKKASKPEEPRHVESLPGQQELDFGEKESVQVEDRDFQGVDTSVGENLKDITIGVRLRTEGGTSRSKALSADDKMRVAEAAGVTTDGLTGASKKLLHPRVEEIKNLNKAISAVNAYHDSMTKPYVEVGIRLLPRDSIAEYTENITRLIERVHARTIELDGAKHKVFDDARLRLKDKFDRDDYPSSFVDCVKLHYEFVNVEPPTYLEELDPSLYDQEVRRVQQRFRETTLLIEKDFIETFQELVDRIVARTEYVSKNQKETDPKTGKEKVVKRTGAGGRVFQESMVEQLVEYIDGFRRLSNTFQAPQVLHEMVDKAEAAIRDRRGNVPSASSLTHELRNSNKFREELHEEFTEVHKTLSNFLTDRPKRRIARK